MQIKPPFLFRVGSKQSRGINTATEIDPLAGYDSEDHDDIEGIGYDGLRQMMYDHVKYNYAAPSEFTSWSVSVLYVLVHAIRKMYHYEDDLLLYVMDTRKLSASRVRCSTDLLKAYDVSWAPNLIDYSLREYLIHGKLEHSAGLWQAVKFDKLITAGFWEAFPSLQQDRYLLLLRVTYLRTVYFPHAWPFMPDNLSTLMSLTKCFGTDWEGVVWVALLLLRCRDLNEQNLATIATKLESTKLRQLPWSTSLSLRSFHATLGQVPEAKHFMRILRLLHDRQQARDREKEALVITIEVHELFDGEVTELWDEDLAHAEPEGRA